MLSTRSPACTARRHARRRPSPQIGATASCSASDEVWMAARLVMILTALDVLVRVGVRVACSDDSEQGGDEGKSAVSEGDLRQREAVGELAGDEAGEGGGAVADEVDDAEDRCPVGLGGAVQQAAGGGADGDALTGTGDDGRADEQRQCAGGGRC